MSRNPFRFSGPVGLDDLIDRDEETDLLVRAADEGNNSRLVAPRRFGKTSLLGRVLGEIRALGWEAVYVDFFGVVTLSDVAERIDTAYARDLSGPVARWFSGLRRSLSGVSVTAGPVGADLRVSPASQALRERLDLPRRVFERHNRRVLVVFDEFQGVLTAQHDADAVIRGVIQHHGEAASYIFAGSHVGMMRELFTDRRRAFYAQAREVALPRLPPLEAAEFLARRFVATGHEIGTALDPLLAVADGHPQRTMLLAHDLWDASAGTSRAADESTFATALHRAMAELNSEFSAVWSQLTTGQRRVLVAVATDGEALYARNGTSSRGGAVAKAVTALIERGELVPDPERVTRHRVVDPLLALWLRAGRPQNWAD